MYNKDIAMGNTLDTKHIKLMIVEPATDGNKHFLVAFDGGTKNDCMAYNWAIESILRREGLHPLHLVGKAQGSKHHPGYHAWEVWMATDRNMLEHLLSEIESRAKEVKETFAAVDAEIE